MRNLETNRPYVFGFIVSLLLTFAAYFAVVNQLLNGNLLVISIVSLAVLQLLVQLFFFLHLASESKPRWNLTIFVSTVGIILIIFIGSLWIMKSLSYHMKTPSPAEINNFIIKDEGVYHK